MGDSTGMSLGVGETIGIPGGSGGVKVVPRAGATGPDKATLRAKATRPVRAHFALRLGVAMSTVSPLCEMSNRVLPRVRADLGVGGAPDCTMLPLYSMSAKGPNRCLSRWRKVRKPGLGWRRRGSPGSRYAGGMRRLRTSALAGTLPPLALAAFISATLVGCSPPVDVRPAKDSANAACAPMMVGLPESLGQSKLRRTNSQGTAAWGDPSLVILRCGVNVPGPTTDRCVNVNGIDWVIKEGDPVWTLTTYGREPATEILMDPDKISSATVLADLAVAAAEIPAGRNCVGQEELQDLPTSQ